MPSSWHSLTCTADTEPFDGDPLRFRLGVEAMRLGLAYEYDPYFSLSIARVDPLPHQLEAVYDYFLKLPRIRFLLADDPGAGKTIMAGLLLKELKIRGLVKRTLIVTPANLSFQWQREMKDKFRENFEVIRSDVLRANYGSNPWQEKNQVITSVSWVSRIEDAKESLLRSHWDLIIVDEAHKMSAASADKKTLAYQLGEALSAMTDHYLLMTATPHKGDPENFCLFLELLDRDVYGDVKSLEEAMRTQRAPRSICAAIKEALVTFPDPETGEVKKLFTKRDVQTTEFQIDDDEWDFYDALTRYVEDQSIKAAGRRLGARPGARLHDGHAPAPLRVQRLRRPPQPGAHAGQAAEDSRRPGRLPAGADRQEAARRLRRPARRRAAGDRSRRLEAGRRLRRSGRARARKSSRLGQTDRPGPDLGKAGSRVQAGQAPRSAHRARHLQGPEDEAAHLHRAQGHARLPGRRRQGRPAARQAAASGACPSRRSTAA